MIRRSIPMAAVLALSGCSEPRAQVPGEIGQNSTGTANVTLGGAGWQAGEAPALAKGLRAKVYAGGLDHPGAIYMLPNGDALVEESEPVESTEQSSGLLAWMERKWKGVPAVRKRRITLLRDADNDGIADVRTVFLDGVEAFGGVALVGNILWVASESGVVHYDYQTGSTRIDKRTAKRAAPADSHYDKFRFRSLISNGDGSKLYATASPRPSRSDKPLGEAGHGTILEFEPSTGKVREFAEELRSPEGLSFGPDGKVLWTTIRESTAEQGGEQVSNSLKALESGPARRCVYCRFAPPDDRRSPLAKSHRTERLERSFSGMAASPGDRPSDKFAAGMFVDRHRSREIDPPAGSDVLFIPFLDGMPSADPIVVMTGFVSPIGTERGRPAGIALDLRGSLLVADVLAGSIWRVSDTDPDDRLPEVPGKSLRARTHDTGDRK